MAGRRRLLILTPCLDDGKPYMILEAVIKAFQNHTGFAVSRASLVRNRSHRRLPENHTEFSKRAKAVSEEMRQRSGVTTRVCTSARLVHVCHTVCVRTSGGSRPLVG